MEASHKNHRPFKTRGTMAFHKAQCCPLCCSTCTPMTSHFQLPPTVSRRHVPYHATEDVLTGGDYPRQDPAKEPPCRPQTECHLERHEAGPHSLTRIPWHHTRPLTLLPNPLYEDAGKTLLSKQPSEEAAWDELGPVPPHHDDDGDSSMFLRGRVLLSWLGPFHSPQAR